MENTVFYVKLVLGKGWEVIERPADDFYKVATDILAIKTVDGEYDDSVYSREQIYKDFEHAVAYINGEFDFAKDGRYFI